MSAEAQTILLGNLPSPTLRLRGAIELTIEREGPHWCVFMPGLDTYGTGPHLTAAIMDYQMCLIEEYEMLREWKDRLGAGLAQEWATMQRIVEERA